MYTPLYQKIDSVKRLDQLPTEVKNYVRQQIHSDLAAEPHQTSHRYGLDNYPDE